MPGGARALDGADLRRDIAHARRGLRRLCREPDRRRARGPGHAGLGPLGRRRSGLRRGHGAGCTWRVVARGAARRRRRPRACAAAVGSVWFPRLDAAAHAGVEYSASNALSRIDVSRGADQTLSFRTAGVNAGTTTAARAGSEERERLLSQASALPFRVAKKRALILGSGAGKNVVQALELGAEAVVAVEINGMIVDYLLRVLPAPDNPYRDPRVRPIIGEGREISARLSRDIRAGATPAFDLVYVPVATLFGSSGHALTETYLMTREAFALYLGMLTPDGWSRSISRWPDSRRSSSASPKRCASSERAHPRRIWPSSRRATTSSRWPGRHGRSRAPELEQLARRSRGGAVDTAVFCSSAGFCGSACRRQSFLYNDVERLEASASSTATCPVFCACS